MVPLKLRLHGAVEIGLYYCLRQCQGYAITSVCPSFCLSDFVQPRAESYAWIYMKFLPKLGLGPVSK